MLDAFAHRALTGQDIRQRREERKAAKSADSVSEVSLNEKEAVRLERALQKWVSEKNYRQYDKSREEIASDLKTSKEFLHHYFLNRLGVDFKTWRTQLRIEDAKKMLLEDKKISTNLVGEMCGFSDRSNFHRQFVKIVGCSPREWRESSGNPRK